MANDLVTIGKNTELSRSTLILPKYGELTESRVVKEMQSVFKGFEFDPDMQCEQTFKSVEQVETYVSEAVKELREIDNEFKMSAITNNGAIAAKRWHFGWIVNKLLKSAAYGSGLAEKIATSSGVSLSYLYQYRAVGANLDIKDAYLLGMYDAGWENIRAIGAIADQDTRDNLIQFYVNSIDDYNNAVKKEQSKAALKVALQQLKQAPAALDCSSPEQIETAADFENIAPEFVEAQKQVLKLTTALRALVKPKNLEPMLKSFGDCFIASNVPEAEARLDKFHEQVKSALDLLQQVENTVPGYRQELESLEKMQVTEVDEE